MDIFDQKRVLDTFLILADRREQDTPRARRRYAAFGCPFNRATLNYGDYTYNAQLPNGSMIFDQEQTISSRCVIERKMDLGELAQCFTHDRERFQNEFCRARDNQAKIYLLIENGNIENLLNGKYRSKFNPNAFVASLVAWLVRYDMTILFCKEESSGRLIREILYRDLKERLERGEYG